MKHIVNSLTSLAQLISTIDSKWHENLYLEVEITRKAKQRTDQQRKAIEVYCRELAKTLNDAGLDQRAVFAKMKEGVDIPWSQDTVKDTLWRRIQVAILGKESTTKLNADEVTRVYDTLNRWTGTTFGIAIQFPEKKEDK